MRASDCTAWIETTYRVTQLSRELGLELAEEYAAALACVEHDTSRMKPVFPVSWCDNVFKIHCSTLDLLAEIADAEVARCGRLLRESLGVETGRHQAWKACARDSIFDRYSLEGRSADEAACRTALLEECGVEITAAEAPAFADCCSAETHDPERCRMIEPSFTRGPCLDYPVCVNRLSGEWLSCSE